MEVIDKGMLTKQVLPDLIRHFVVFHQNKDQLIKIVPKIVPATTSTLLTLDNPTLVVPTDRNDLDDQLFDTFSLSQDLLRQTPVKAENRDRLKGRLLTNLWRNRVHDYPEIPARNCREN